MQEYKVTNSQQTSSLFDLHLKYFINMISLSEYNLNFYTLIKPQI